MRIYKDNLETLIIVKAHFRYVCFLPNPYYFDRKHISFSRLASVSLKGRDRNVILSFNPQA